MVALKGSNNWSYISQIFSFSFFQAFEDCLVLDGILEKHNNDFG